MRGAARSEPQTVESRSQALERTRAERLAQLNGIASRHLEGVTYSALVESDEHTAHAIAERAREIGAAMIVTGTHGRSGISRALLGSVAERLVRESPVPVLVVRQGMAVAS